MKTDNANTAELALLRKAKRDLTAQQYKTLRGQVLAGDAACAMKELRNIMLRPDGMRTGKPICDESMK